MKKKNKSLLSIKDILKGKFLVEENSFRHWRFLFFLALLAFISISSSHWADKKVVEIRALQTEVSNLKAEHSDLHKSVMQSKMESFVKEKVMKDSIVKSSSQPFMLTRND